MLALARSWPSSPCVAGKVLDGALTKKLILLDGAYNLSRHITVISANQFRISIGNSIKTFTATSYIDEFQTDTATALVDPSLAAPCAATASPSPPVSVIEHATFAPVDVYTKPDPVIELMPAPVIEYIAPSAAESYPSFVPSFVQIHEAVTDSEKSKFLLLMTRLHRCQWNGNRSRVPSPIW